MESLIFLISPPIQICYQLIFVLYFPQYYPEVFIFLLIIRVPLIIIGPEQNFLGKFTFIIPIIFKSAQFIILKFNPFIIIFPIWY